MDVDLDVVEHFVTRVVVEVDLGVVVHFVLEVVVDVGLGVVVHLVTKVVVTACVLEVDLVHFLVDVLSLVVVLVLHGFFGC